jgi:protein-tyrosine sulfotransferase
MLPSSDQIIGRSVALMDNERDMPLMPLVILGFPRSGTTLLTRLLDAHPQISAPPETGLLSAAGRFLKELNVVEGPPVGVLTGLSFAGVPPQDTYAAMRTMLFGLHDKISAGRPIWIEKTATDLFHLETLEPLLLGHVRFLCITRNPLDVVPSNVDLARTMGARLPELAAMTRDDLGEYDGIAAAWIDRQTALDAFAQRHPQDCFSLRYEDLVAEPEVVLTKILAFAGLADLAGVGHSQGAQTTASEMIATTFSGNAQVGMGDFKFDDTSGLQPVVVNAWRKRLPRAAASRLVPILAPLMAKHGYDVPKVPPVPSRDVAIRQFQLAARMKRQNRPTE